MDYSLSQVESFLLGRIDSDTWPIGSRIPSERELSEELGVSRNMIRHAVVALASRGFLERSVGLGTFVRRKQIVASAGGSARGNVGYVVCREKTKGRPTTTEDFNLDAFRGVEEEVSQSGRHTLFCYLDDFDAGDIDQFRAFLGKVDGAVIQEARNPRVIDCLRAGSVPAVMLVPSESLTVLDYVTMDLSAAMDRAVRYLRGLGHQRIALVNGPAGFDAARSRHKAWQDALSSAADDTLVECGEGWTADAGYAATKRLSERRADLTAVLCATSRLALGSLAALAELRLGVPSDVSVMAFDDIELTRYSSPPLTTMRIPALDMARTAARRLLERVDHENLPRIRIRYPLDLVIRGSCAAART